uniref:Uncharacterized protein n=1 Tax=Arundo donax TaxID=35708 RepID=A0A0A9HG34_ARUDO
MNCSCKENCFQKLIILYQMVPRSIESTNAPCRSSVVLKWFDTAILEDLIKHLASNTYKK